MKAAVGKAGNFRLALVRRGIGLALATTEGSSLIFIDFYFLLKIN